MNNLESRTRADFCFCEDMLLVDISNDIHSEWWLGRQVLQLRFLLHRLHTLHVLQLSGLAIRNDPF